jgi:putative endonuclease
MAGAGMAMRPDRNAPAGRDPAEDGHRPTCDTVASNGENPAAARRAYGAPDRARRGCRNYHAGLAAEDQVARSYERSGHRIRARRWRGGAGEIDLVLEKGDELVFVEVKAASTHARAAEALSQRQVRRLLKSAEAYLGQMPRGSLTPMRFDVALVDRAGQLDVIPNALCA